MDRTTYTLTIISSKLNASIISTIMEKIATDIPCQLHSIYTSNILTDGYEVEWDGGSQLNIALMDVTTGYLDDLATALENVNADHELDARIEVVEFSSGMNNDDTHMATIIDGKLYDNILCANDGTPVIEIHRLIEHHKHGTLNQFVTKLASQLLISGQTP